MNAIPDHHSIGEVLATLRADFPDITISKIRFLESQGLIDPERTPSGYRKFRDGDVARLRWVLGQQKDNFLPLKVIKARLDAVGPDEVPDDSDPSGAPEPATVSKRPTPTKPKRAAKAKPSRAASTRGAARTGGGAKPTREARRETPAIFENQMLPLDDGVGNDLESDQSGASLTRIELANATGLSEQQMSELEEYGLLVPAAGSGERVLFDEDALVVARLAAEFAGHGIGPRHLRMFRVAAEREAGLYDQVIAPRLARRNPEARAKAREDLVDLARLGRGLRAAFLRTAASGLLHD
ncbi:MAG: MerR family transcriptional regulator [Acidimicrobiia bacterium]